MNNSEEIKQPLILNSDKNLNPIILIPGSTGNQLAWKCTEKFFKQYFRNYPVYAFTLDLPFNHYLGTQALFKSLNDMIYLADINDWSIEQYTDELEKRVQYVKSKHNNLQPILVGYSMGGLVAVDHVLRYNSLYAITISSPMQGTPVLNKWPFNFNAHLIRYKQMMPECNFIKNINDQMQKIPDKFLTIGSTMDLHVPNESSMVRGVEHFSVDTNGHFSIVENPNVWKKIAAWLDKKVVR